MRLKMEQIFCSFKVAIDPSGRRRPRRDALHYAIPSWPAEPNVECAAFSVAVATHLSPQLSNFLLGAQNRTEISPLP